MTTLSELQKMIREDKSRPTKSFKYSDFGLVLTLAEKMGGFAKYIASINRSLLSEDMIADLGILVWFSVAVVDYFGISIEYALDKAMDKMDYKPAEKKDDR